MDLDGSARRLAYLQGCLAMSSVAVAVAPTCVAAASDSAGLDIGATWATVSRKPKLWATDSVVAGVAGVVQTPNVDLLGAVRGTLASATGGAAGVAADIAKHLDATGAVVAGLAKATLKHAVEEAPFCTTVAVAEPGYLAVVSIDWHGQVDVTAHYVSSDAVLAAIGARPAQVDLVEAERNVVLLAAMHKNADTLADAYLNVVTGRINGLVLAPPRLFGQPTVTAPIKWVTLTKTTRLAGQMVPPALDDLRP